MHYHYGIEAGMESLGSIDIAVIDSPKQFQAAISTLYGCSLFIQLLEFLCIPRQRAESPEIYLGFNTFGQAIFPCLITPLKAFAVEALVCRRTAIF